MTHAMKTIRSCAQVYLQEGLSGVHVCAETELARGLLSDEQLVTSHHLHVNALFFALLDGFLGVVARRVEQWQQTDEFPFGCTTQRCEL